MARCDGRGFAGHHEVETVFSDGRCVLHSEDPSKPNEPVAQALVEMRATRRFGCPGWVFPAAVDLKGQQFQEARFEGASFSGDARFEGATFSRAPDFKGAIVSAAQLPGLLRSLPLVSLVGCEVQEEREARRSRWFQGYWLAELAYREVRRSLEEGRHFREAGHFAARELEMRRLDYLAGREAPWWQRLWGQLWANLLSPEALYMQLSGYGESWRKPLLWLAATLLASPLLFAWAGANLGHGQYTLAPPGAVGLSEWWDAHTSLLVFALRAAAYLPEPQLAIPAIPQNLGVVACQVFLRLAAPFLAFLLGLAVRRRFRR